MTFTNTGGVPYAFGWAAAPPTLSFAPSAPPLSRNFDGFFMHVGFQLAITKAILTKLLITLLPDIRLTIFFPLTTDQSGILPHQLLLKSSTHADSAVLCAPYFY